MYVTSDIFDLKRIGRYRSFDWRENLLGGVAVHGTQWRGYQAGARFLLEATRRCGLVVDEMQHAFYKRPGDRQSRPIKSRSFEKLARGELVGARNADVVMLRGELDAAGAQDRVIRFGGEAWLITHRVGTPMGPQRIDDYPYPAFMAYFIFPLHDDGAKAAIELVRLAVEVLGAEYGYCFIRDELCFPSVYPGGHGPVLDMNPLAYAEGFEMRDWGTFVYEGRLWTEPWPIFRDLYQVNLISERHTRTPIQDLGYLLEWIGAQPGRGRLDDIGEGRRLWILTDQEVVDVRPQLNAAGVLLSCPERVYRDLPEGAAVAQRLFEDQRVNWAPWVSDARLDYPGRFRD